VAAAAAGAGVRVLVVGLMVMRSEVAGGDPLLRAFSCQPYYTPGACFNVNSSSAFLTTTQMQSQQQQDAFAEQRVFTSCAHM
jgi:hypothetical protein